MALQDPAATTMLSPDDATEAPCNDPPEMSGYQRSLEAIIGAVERREQEARAAVFDASTAPKKRGRYANAVEFSAFGGPLTTHQLSVLTMLCIESARDVKASLERLVPGTDPSLEGLGTVDGGVLVALVALLEQHVASACSVDVIQEAYDAVQACPTGAQGDQTEATDAKATTVRETARMDQWLKETRDPSFRSSGPGIQRLQLVQSGLEAGSILMAIMTSPGVDRRLVSEDCINLCISLLRHHLSKNLLPAIAHTGHVTLTRRSSEPDSTKSTDDPSPPPKKPKKNPTKGDSKEQCIVRGLKKLYPHILNSYGMLQRLLEGMDKLVRHVALDDRPILTMSGAALSVFPANPATPLEETTVCRQVHIMCIELMTTIFTKYPQHRPILVQDLFPIMRNLPSSKRTIRTYSLRTDEDAVSIKRTLFSGASGAEGNHCIQAMTALIVSLVQSCVEMPTVTLSLDRLHGHNTSTEGAKTRPSPRMRSGLAACQSVCTMFVSQLLQRCSRKGEEGGASEFRPIMSNLLDDLLFLQLMPDHPAAEMLLFLLFHMLSQDVLRACSTGRSSASATIESTYLATAFDAMGRISAAMARLVAIEREEPYAISRFQSEAPVEESPPTDASRCPCGRTTWVDTFMVNCDECQSWFHGECVGLTRETVGKVWACNECTLRRIVEEETKLFASRSRLVKDTSELSLSDTHVFRQLVLNYLFNKSEADSSLSVDLARKFQLSKWIKDLDEADDSDDSSKGSFESKVLRDHFLSQWDRPSSECFTKPGFSRKMLVPCLNRQGNLRATRTLLMTTSDSARSFGRQLGLYVQMMGDESPVSFRKLAVKAIAQVVEMDPALMLNPNVTKAVSSRFRDDAKSVREAALALVGSFVHLTPEVANAFHGSLLPCLSDPGVSVKKRAVRILSDIVRSNPSYRGRAAACAVMLRQAADPKEDDSVRDLIHELFTEMWLVGGRLESDTLPKLPHNKACMSGPEIKSGVVTPLTPGGQNALSDVVAQPFPSSKPETRCELAAGQMVEVTMAAGSKDAVVSLLRELMLGLSDADKDRKLSEREEREDALDKHTTDLVDSLMERLSCLERSRASKPTTFGPELLATIRTLGVFADVAPNKLLKHLDILVLYMKEDNDVSKEEESRIISESCDIVLQLTTVMCDRDVRILAATSVPHDLVRATYRFGNHVISSAVRLLCRLSNHKTAGEQSLARTKTFSLAQKFYKYLAKNLLSGDESLSRDPKVRSNIKRALSVLGSFCRSYSASDVNLFQDEGEAPTVVKVEDLSWANVSYGCFGLFIAYFQEPDVSTRCAAFRAMTGIFMSCPRVLLMVEQDGTIEEIMSQRSPPELQLESLRCWKDILVQEEQRLERADEKAAIRKEARNNQISGDQDGDATLIGGVLTQHAKRLFEMTKSSESSIRLASVDLLGQLLRQGLLNPMDAVPYLLALQGDVHQPEVRSLSLKLLVAEGEKRPDMLRQHVCAGVKQAYVFQRAIHSSSVVPTAVIRRRTGDATGAESIFAGAFVECVRSNKKQRHGLFLNLLNLFEIDDHTQISSGQRKDDAALDLQLLSFVAEVLAHLPYNTAGDPLFLIHHISSLAALQGAQLADRIAEFLRCYGLSSANEHDDHIASEDPLEMAARGKSPSRTRDVSVINTSAFDMARFSVLCSDACAVTLLLRLKTFFRKAYNLSETRCLEYSPNSRERSHDKIIATPSNMPAFDSKLRGIGGTKAASSRGSFDKDGLIIQYAEFRKVMRLEHSADVRMTDSDDEDYTSSRKRKSNEGDIATV